MLSFVILCDYKILLKILEKLNKIDLVYCGAYTKLFNKEIYQKNVGLGLLWINPKVTPFLLPFLLEKRREDNNINVQKVKPFDSS